MLFISGEDFPPLLGVRFCAIRFGLATSCMNLSLPRYVPMLWFHKRVRVFPVAGCYY